MSGDRGGCSVLEDLVEVEIQKVIGPVAAGAAVLLGNDEKSFVVYIGVVEAQAIRRELTGETTERPLTHDLLQSVLLGFDIVVSRVVVTQIRDNAFCATLILEQKVTEENQEWVGRRNEVRIDARPSDCMVLALKNQTKIQVTREVFEKVQDVSQLEYADLDLGGSAAFADPSETEDPDLLSSWGVDLEPEGEDDDDDL